MNKSKLNVRRNKTGELRELEIFNSGNQLFFS